MIHILGALMAFITLLPLAYLGIDSFVADEDSGGHYHYSVLYYIVSGIVLATLVIAQNVKPDTMIVWMICAILIAWAIDLAVRLSPRIQARLGLAAARS